MKFDMGTNYSFILAQSLPEVQSDTADICIEIKGQAYLLHVDVIENHHLHLYWVKHYH